MSLEAKLEALTAAVLANTEALKGAKGAPAASGKPGKTSPAEKTSKFTPEQVKAAAVKVKDKLGTGEAKRLIKEVGKADELMKIEVGNYDAFIAACEKAVAAAEEPEDGGDGDL